MKRHLLNLQTALSLLLCVAVVALWVRSYWRSDQVIAGRRVQDEGYDLATRSAQFYSGRGGLMLASWTIQWRGDVSSVQTWRGPGLDVVHHSQRDPEPPWAPVSSRESRRVIFNFLGFGFARRGIVSVPAGPGAAGLPTAWLVASSVWAPHWAVAALAAVLPTRAALVRLRRRRHVAGRCGRCGYNLRATPGRCPECGTVTAAASTSSASPPTAAPPGPAVPLT